MENKAVCEKTRAGGTDGTGAEIEILQEKGGFLDCFSWSSTGFSPVSDQG
jgi:hypothetical protein